MTRSPRLTDRLLSELGLPSAAHLILLGVVSMLVWGAIPTSLFVLWVGSVVAIVSARAVLWARARRFGVPPPAVAVLVRVTMVCLGLAWGLGTAVAVPHLPPSTVNILLLGLTGLLAGGIATLLADAWAFPLYAAAMFGPVSVSMALHMSGQAGGVAIVFIIVFTTFSIRLQRQARGLLVEQIHAQDALRNRERQLAEAQALAHVGSWEWDMRANQVTWSEELYHMYGAPPGSAAGYEEFLARVHPEDRSRVKQLVEQQFANHQPLEYEWRVQRPDGEVRHLHSRQVVSTDGGGQPVRMSGTSHDITERKRAEENQAHLVSELTAAIKEVKTLRGILPVCANCKRIKNENGGWEQIESYVRGHTHAEFSHGLCPDCAKATWG